MEARSDNLKNRIEKANKVLLGKITELLPGGKQNGKSYRCDNKNGGYGRNPSFSVNMETGKCCEFGNGDVADGKEWGDLLDVHREKYGQESNVALDEILGEGFAEESKPSNPIESKLSQKAKKTIQKLTHVSGVELPTDKKAGSDPIYIYSDYDGVPQYYKKGKKLTWIHTKEDGWVTKTSNVDFECYPYRANVLLEAKTWLIVEGEKCADYAANNREKLKLPSSIEMTTFWGGAHNWEKTDWSNAKGKTIIILPDADKPENGKRKGQDSFRGLAQHLLSVGAEVKEVDIGDILKKVDDGELESGADVADGIFDDTLSDRIDKARRFYDCNDDDLAELGVMTFRALAKKSKEPGKEGVTIPTGFPRLDSALDGGFGEGELIVVGAYTSHGKSALAIRIADQVSTKHPVLFVSLEMTFKKIFQRIVKANGNPDDPEELDRDIHFLGGIHNFGEIEKRVEKLHKKRKYAMIFIDHLHVGEGAGQGEIENIAGGIKIFQKLANRLNVPVVALSQTNRKHIREDRAIRLDDLYGSVSIEFCADKVICLKINKEKTGVMTILKNKEGETGRSVPVKLDPKTGTFEEREGEWVDVGSVPNQPWPTEWKTKVLDFWVLQGGKEFQIDQVLDHVGAVSMDEKAKIKNRTFMGKLLAHLEFEGKVKTVKGKRVRLYSRKKEDDTVQLKLVHDSKGGSDFTL